MGVTIQNVPRGSGGPPVMGRTGNLGCIVPDLSNPFFAAVLRGVQARARTADYAVFLADSDEHGGAELELVEAMARQVDGLILCASRQTTAQLDQVLGTIPLVFVNRPVPGQPAVILDAAGGMRQALDHLAALGHRRVAYLGGPRVSWSAGERRRGLRHAERLGTEIVELGPFPPTFEDGRAAADQALAQRVTAIVAYNDLMALGVLSRLADRGVAVPAEMSVIGFDDIALAAKVTPALTTVALQTERAGREAVDLLLARMTGARADQRRDLTATLVVRASTGPPAHRVAGSPPSSAGS